MGVTIGRRSAAGISMLLHSTQEYMQHRRRKKRNGVYTSNTACTGGATTAGRSLADASKGHTLHGCSTEQRRSVIPRAAAELMLSAETHESSSHERSTGCRRNFGENPNFGRVHTLSVCEHKNLKKTAFFKGKGPQIFAAGLPPHTPVWTHTPVSRYISPPPRAPCRLVPATPPLYKITCSTP